MHISFLIKKKILYIVMYRVVQSCFCKEQVKTYNSWQLPHIIIQLTPAMNL